MAVNYNTRVVNDGLMLYLDAANVKSYAGTGTVWTDLSANNNDGTLVNSPTYDTSDVTSFLLSNGNDLISVADLNLQQSFTLSCWCKQLELDSFSFFGQGGLITNGGLHIWYVNNTTIRFGMYSNDTDFTVSTSTNVWYNFVFTYDHNSPYTKKMYINGEEVVGVNVSGPNQYIGTGTFRIGATYSSGSFGYGNGYFSNVSGYNRTLTQSEIQQNFNALRGRYNL